MSNLIKIENALPRIVSFKGQVTLKPGTNEVDADTWAKIKAEDVVCQAMLKENGIREEGAAYAPPSDEVMGTKPNKVVTSEIRRVTEDDVEKQAEAEAVDATPVEPTPVGGGNVEGNANQAKSAVMACEDVAQLSTWLENESRATVRRAIKNRLDELGG